MVQSTFSNLGTQLRSIRVERGMTQPQLASRLGRNRARISELERDLFSNRMGRDRLTLFAEICDALDMVPMLVPRARVDDVQHLIKKTDYKKRHINQSASAFDELFVDLGDQDGDAD